MSFDTTFDFTALIVQSQNTIGFLTNEQTNLNALQTELQQIQGYSELIQPQIDSITQTLISIDSQLDQCNKALSIIATIQTLDDADKQLLYTFFGFTTISASSFTGKLLGGYQLMLQDPNIISLVGDNVNSDPLKTIVGNSIIKGY